MLDQDLLSRAKHWARRQEFINGRFAEVDRSTGEVLSEHMHPRFIRVGDMLVDEFERPERMYKSSIGQVDGTWAMVLPDGSVMRRAYTPAERAKAVRMVVSDGVSMASVGRLLNIPRRTVQAWVRRDAVAAA